MRHRLRIPARAFVRPLCLALFAVAAIAPLAGAQELIPPKTTDRHFPTTLFCPIGLDLQFTANGPTAKISFSTNVFYLRSDDGLLHWTQETIDDICVAPDAVYQSNLGPSGSYSSSCYTDAVIPNRFYFQNAGAIPLRELFAADPASTGWDLAHGAFWNQTSSAPNDPGTETNRTGGCLGLGQDSATPSASDVASTSITVSGLTAGQVYDLSGWWNVNDVFINFNQVLLTITVTGSGTTPITKRTWGGLKRDYR